MAKLLIGFLFGVAVSLLVFEQFPGGSDEALTKLTSIIRSNTP